MKFFAPTASWDMKSESSWWPMLGTAPTSAGVRVSQETALTYSAVFACTRVISETLASLPLNLLEQVDTRTTKKAYDHPLYPVLHDMPNPEMDIVTFLDMQQALTLNWGNSYAEIQRDLSGNVVGLWPIHPSRIPLCNITRNATEAHYGEIVAGDPGEIVYWVKNDDGTTTPIPASDMLHIPGALSKNGITGISLPLTCADAIGIAVATERHAGAYFRNGAVSNMALTHPKQVKKETAEYLREQWQKTFGGVHNHYKTLILEDGMTANNFSIAPEASQLIESRALNSRIVASQIYRVPSHMIGDKEASTFNNVEQEEMSFKTKTMLIWIVKWEKAIYRQLLSPREREKYRAKFNVMGLLRGDSAARAQFYQVLFNIGVFSPNDIRELEDLNPVPGGEQRFVPANNLVPLDKIGEMAQAQIDNLKAPAPQPQQNDAPDEKTAAALVEIRNQHREFMEKVMMRDATAEAREAARVEFDRQQRAADVEQYGQALEEILARHRQEAETASDTAEIERLAAERAVFERAKAEQDAANESVRASARQMLEAALRREIEQLAAKESKWLASAKPKGWEDAKVVFYGQWTQRFVDRMAEFEPFALSCGVKINPTAAAESYARLSLRELKVTDAAARDNYHDELERQVEAIKSSWGPRAADLAKWMVDSGLAAYQETNNA